MKKSAAEQWWDAEFGLGVTNEDQLRALYADGLSYSAIGRALGKTRNAIAGKVKRLKLPLRKVIDDTPPPSAPAAAKVA